MKSKISAIVACGTFPAVILCWYLLTSGNAKWLKVEAPQFAVKGQALMTRVTLTSPIPGLYLGADLHGIDRSGESTGFLSFTGNVRIEADKKIYDFYITVPGNTHVSSVSPVIILSRDGTWTSRISAAYTEPVPVEMSGRNNKPGSLEYKRVQDIAANNPPPNNESRVMAVVISGIWLTVSALTLFSRKNPRTELIAVAAAVSSAWELFNSSTVISSILRITASGIGMYSERRMPQQVLTFIIILALFVFAVYIITCRNKSFRILPWTCIGAYWCINLLQVLSLHETDRLLAVTFVNIQSAQLVKLAAAGLCFVIILTGRINKRKNS